jgi:FkbM family methyltransferase
MSLEIILARLGLLRKPRSAFKILKKGVSAELGLSRAVHVGAHFGEEREVYEALGFSEVLWIEASRQTYQTLVEHLGKPTSAKTRHIAVNALVSDQAGQQIELRHFSNEGASNSIFPAAPLLRETWPTLHETGTTETVTSDTLDRIALAHGFATADLLVADVQGAELLVLKGALKLLASAKAVAVEVSTHPYYEGGVLQPELRGFLRGHGFIETRRAPKHGDQLFVRA